MKITLPGGAGMMGQWIVRDLLSDRAIIDIDEVGIGPAPVSFPSFESDGLRESLAERGRWPTSG